MTTKQLLEIEDGREATTAESVDAVVFTLAFAVLLLSIGIMALVQLWS